MLVGLLVFELNFPLGLCSSHIALSVVFVCVLRVADCGYFAFGVPFVN